MIVSLLLGTLLTVLAALVPALRATRIQPIAGLREGAVLETSTQRAGAASSGAGIAGLGVVAMLLGLFGILDPGEIWVGVGAAACSSASRC